MSQKDKCGEDKYLEKLFFENSFYFDLYENRFDDFVRSHFLECLYKKNNPNNELKDEYIFKHYVWWQKSSGYKEEVVKFLKGFENMQKYRGEKVINKLKGAFCMDEKARLMMMASYDLREDWHNELGTWNHDICNQLSKKNIYRSCWLFYTYKKMTDKRELDASNGKYQLMMDIYNTLWGHYQGKLDGIPDSKGYSDGFRYNYIFDKGLLFGGDTMHSIMNSTDFIESDIKTEDFSHFCTLYPTFENLESIIHASGCIGNYILVPAYFNSQRPGKDNWLCAISYLSKNNWDIATKAREKSRNKLKNDLELEKQAKKTWKIYEHTTHFSKYVNGMFLWDYVSVDEKDKNKASRYFVEKKLDIKTDQEEICRLIYRRGVFMAAMLCIAGIDKNVYSEIQKNVFAVDETYNGYSAVISKINEIIGNKELVGGIKTYVTALKKCLCETDIRDSIKK